LKEPVDDVRVQAPPVSGRDRPSGVPWSIRCVRVYRDRSSAAISYARPSWRDVLPEAVIATAQEINRDSQFHKQDIERSEFETVWKAVRAGSRRA
jgi:hypothetical protein